MRISALTNVADDSRTMLSGGLTQQRREPLRARTNAIAVISALPFAFYRKSVQFIRQIASGDGLSTCFFRNA